MKVSGIYKIINKVNKKYYVGSSQNIGGRWSDHKKRLRKNKHFNLHLQWAWNKYGEANFDFVIIESVPIEELFEAEQRHLDWILGGAYNQSFDARSNMRGKTHTAKSRQKISNGLKGNKCRLGIKHTPADRAKIGNALRGRKQSPSHVDARKNPTLYKWHHQKLGVTEILKLYDFRMKYGIPHEAISRLLHGKCNLAAKGWSLTHID